MTGEGLTNDGSRIATQFQMDELRADPRAPNLQIGERVTIEPGSVIGANVVIHGDTTVAAGAVIKHNAVIGISPSLAVSSRAERKPFETTIIAPRATICCGAVIMAGARLGESSIVGDHGYVRERAHIGRDCVLGRGVTISAGVVIGDRVNIQGVSVITPGAQLEDDVFVGPGVILTTDDTIGRRDPALRTRIVLRRACRIGGGVTMIPGVEIGEEAFVAAGSLVTRDVPPFARVKGAPAREYGKVNSDEKLENWR